MLLNTQLPRPSGGNRHVMINEMELFVFSSFPINYVTCLQTRGDMCVVLEPDISSYDGLYDPFGLITLHMRRI